MTSNIVKLKGTLTAACRANKDGYKDIFQHLMEVASDVIEEMDPEDIDSHIFAGENVGNEEIIPDMVGLSTEDMAEMDVPNIEDDGTLEVSNHGSSLSSILATIGKPSKKVAYR